MSASKTETLKSRLETVVALGPAAGTRGKRVAAPSVADQYRGLVQQLKAALAPGLPTSALDAILGAYPATAELYENMHYETSGLSRSPLDRSVATEMLASEWLHRAARKDSAG